jgi:hypothetical protein
VEAQIRNDDAVGVLLEGLQGRFSVGHHLDVQTGILLQQPDELPARRLMILDQ